MDKPLIDLSNKTKEIHLDGPEGNAFALMGLGKRWIKEAGFPELANEFVEEATSGDYQNLLDTFNEWFGTELAIDEDPY